jgi:hypothetical protein
MVSFRAERSNEKGNSKKVEAVGEGWLYEQRRGVVCS